MQRLTALGLLALFAVTIGAQEPAGLPGAEDDSVPAEIERRLAEAIAERDAARSEAARLAASVELELSAAQTDRATLAELRQENSNYEARIDLYRGSIPWPWVAAAVIVALGAGFVGGWWWLDSSIRRRYGGFKMY
ncbi:MAG: hypothetical protein PVH89_00435 [Gammaproteobacteria bacterium]